MSRFWEAFNKPVMLRTGQDEFVLTLAGWILAISFVGLITLGFFLYLAWKDKKEGVSCAKN